MLYHRDYDCEKCDECIADPGKTYCNISCTDTDKNCRESYKVFNPEVYGKAYVKPQVYENLFNVDDAFKAGTIFMDLYSPYCEVKYIGGNKSHE